MDRTVTQTLLLTDLYELTMLAAYDAYSMREIAVFELFVRKLPEPRNFLIAAGLEQLILFLEDMRFAEDELAWLRGNTDLPQGFLERLASIRFTGDVDAMPEGTVFFANEPILRVTAPLPEAQLIEPRLINLIHLQTVIASKAARMVLSAPGKQLVDFGLRRAHGAEAGLLAARASYLAGFDSTATVLAQREFGIPIAGTMAHSFIQTHDSEEEAFERFARVRPRSLTLLIDTYDTERAAGIVAGLAPRLANEGIMIDAVRIDSGDLGLHARLVRNILDNAGQGQIRIIVSGGLDEWKLQALCAAKAPIDGFGIGTSLTTASDAPALDCAYKLQEYAGRPRRKRSEGKATWPGRKQVYRQFHDDGTIRGDTIALIEEQVAGEKLLVPAMIGGKRVAGFAGLAQARADAAQSLRSLPAELRGLGPGTIPVEISQGIRRLAEQL